MGAYDFNFDLPAGETFIPRPERVVALLKAMPPEPSLRSHRRRTTGLPGRLG